jgi:ketosteroid isomerase-like protein
MLRSPRCPWRPQVSRFHVLLLMLCAVSCAAVAKAADTREVELKKVRAEFWKYFAAGDATSMATIVTDDFVQFSETATFLDKTTFLTSVKTKKYSKVENPTLDDVVDPRVRFYGTVAIVTYSAPLAAESGSVDAATPRTRVTEVWAKIEGKRWKIANIQITRRPAPAPVAPAAK